MSYADYLRTNPGTMTTRELIQAIDAEPEGTPRWRRLCREATARSRNKAFPAWRLPQSYDPDARTLPMDLTELERP